MCPCCPQLSIDCCVALVSGQTVVVVVVAVVVVVVVCVGSSLAVYPVVDIHF